MTNSVSTPPSAQSSSSGKAPLWAIVAGACVATAVVTWVVARRSGPGPAGGATSSSVSASSAGSASAAPSAPAPPKFDVVDDGRWKAGVPLRPMDKDIFDKLMSDKLERKELPDLFPDRPYRVRVVGSVAERRYGFVFIDLTRSGKNDERWELTGSDVKRSVPNDPDAYAHGPMTYTLSHGRWQPH